MAELGKVSPNRMELLKNKRRLVLAQRGHKLLKDKYDELIRRFLDRIRENRDLRSAAENKLRVLYEEFTLLRAEAPKQEILHLLEKKPLSLTLDLTYKNLLNTQVPVINLHTASKFNYPAGTTPLNFEDFVKQLEECVKQLIQLAQYEQTVRVLAAEIEKTRRRVNALEHVLIPSITENIRFISMKMDEMDRETRTRLMKIKEMLTATSVLFL